MKVFFSLTFFTAFSCGSSMTFDSIPVLLDNQSEGKKLSDCLNHFIFPFVEEMYIATGYFYLSGFESIQNGLFQNPKIKSEDKHWIKMIISPKTDQITKEVLHLAEKNNLEKSQLIQGIIQDFETSLGESTVESAEKLVELLKKQSLSIRLFLKDFFHAKAYIAKVLHGGFPHDYTIVGSSNFTRNGLSHNRELNLVQEGSLHFEASKKWFLDLWENETIPLDATLLQVIENSILKARNKDSQKLDSDVFLSPLKMLLYLIRYYIGELTEEDLQINDQLVEFQRIGAENIISKLEKLDGAIISDSVGLGKTFTAGEVIKRYIKNGKRVLILTPPHIVLEQWRDTLKKYFHLEESKNLILFSQGKFAQLEHTEIYNIFQGKIDLIVVDEAHRARNRDSKLYQNLNRIHPFGERLKVLLLTATPFNNRIGDLENLIKLCTTETKLTNAGFVPKAFHILEDYGNKLRNGTPLSEIESDSKYSKNRGLVKDILNAIMLLRMRTSIKERYGKITIAGKPLVFEDPIVKKISYTYSNEFQELFHSLPEFLQSLELPHIRISKVGNSGFALSGLFKLLLFKRIESSLYAFYSSLNRIIQRELELKEKIETLGFEKTVAEYKEKSDPELYYSELEDLEDSASVEFTKEELLLWIDKDIEFIQKFIQKYLVPHQKEKKNPLSIVDPKIDIFLKLLKEPGYKKALIFTTFKDTILYIDSQLKFQKENGLFQLEYDVVSGEDKNSKWIDLKLDRFAPKARNAANQNNEKELDILISTDVLSEGVNLQDADMLVNFDLPWNPMRIVQRIGRVNRIGSENKVKVFNMSPDNTLDDFLNLLLILESKVKMIASLLGKEMAIINSESEEIRVEDIGEEIKKRENIHSISDYERLSSSRSFFGDLEGETEEDYFKSFLFFAAQENKLREEDFKLIHNLYANKIYYSIFNPEPKQIFTFYEIYGKKNDYLDVLSRVCIHTKSIDGSNSVENIESKWNYPFNLFSKEHIKSLGYVRWDIKNNLNFQELEKYNEQSFSKMLTERKKLYSIVSLNQRTKNIKGDQLNIIAVLDQLFRDNNHLIGNSFVEILEQKNLLSKIEDLKKILMLFQLDNKRLRLLGKKLEKNTISKLEYEAFAEELSDFYDTIIWRDPNFRGVLYKEDEIYGRKIAWIGI